MVKRRSAKERREKLTAWLDSVEFRVKSRLRELGLPEEIAELQEHLSKALTPQGRNLSRADLLTATTKRLVQMKPGEWSAYDLLCCLACIRNSRQLLKQREPEGVVMQAYVLGVRAAKAGVRPLEAMGQQYRAAQKKKGRRSGEERRDRREKDKIKARKAYEECLRNHPGKVEQAYLAAANKVGKKPRTVRFWLTGK